jgi:hypothetical protein
LKASDIIAALKSRHDLLYTEVPMHGRNTKRLDAWALVPSWTNPGYIGYEVKVSRSDFVQDNKWMAYLPCCSQFYFVCPYGVIKPEEVGEHAGLMYINKTGGLRVKKKAPYREIAVDAVHNVMKSMLMREAHTKNNKSNAEYWDEWLKKKNDWNLLGRSVSRKMNERVNKRIHAAESENIRLQDIRTTLEELGFKGVPYAYEVERRLRGEARVACEKIFRHVGRLQAVYDELLKDPAEPPNPENKE